MAGIAALTGYTDCSREEVDLQTARALRTLSDRCVKDAD